MVLVSLKDVSIGFGEDVLLDKVNLQIEQGERICLIGRNGTGKSTLLRLINGDMLPDSGVTTMSRGLKTALLTQEVPLGMDGTVYDVVSSGSEQPRQKIQAIISRMNLDENAESLRLSAGLKRRIYLAKALLNEPDILLLDEPTNHLDIDSITWMEQFLLRFAGTILFVTHDRVFLQRLATRIVEIDRSILNSFHCTYDKYLERKQETLESETAQNKEYDKQLKREEIWLRQGIKARRTRNEGRVRALIEMRAEVAKRRKRTGNIRFLQEEAEKSGKMVVEAESISFSFKDNIIIKNLSLTIMRGDKVGVVGPNGCGKTTLLRILLGELAPDDGFIRHGTRLEIAYFDQLREQLDDSKTMQQNIADDNDMVFINGKPRHVISYLKDFLFLPDQIRAPITALSGGEKNRLLLAKLFKKSSNVLALDEPTNDLDAESLDLLEEKLIDYAGTILMVSHDRAFLNNVATSTLVFEGNGHVTEYIGGYDDWQQQFSEKAEKSYEQPRKKTKIRKADEGESGRRKKLTFKEQKELEQLPDEIDRLEEEKKAIFAAMADPELYRTSGEKVSKLQSLLNEIEHSLEESYKRWELLEDISSETGK